ncbi:MAG: alpha/beta hydrolase [Longimicrobiaceae bacterium]
MSRLRIVPLALAALALAACSERSDPLGAGAAAPRPPSRALAAALPAADTELVLQQVQLRPGVTADLHLEVFVDEARQAAPCAAPTVVLAVHGFTHTAATWARYADARFAEPEGRPCAVLALDLPGHGGSSLPQGLLFGELTLDDYATALLAVLDALEGSAFAPTALIGHSQGGLVIQMAQQRRVDGGSSLRQADGIAEVELLASAFPAGLPWSFAESGAAAALLGSLIVPGDPVLGPHVAVPPGFWPVLFFTNLSGGLAPGAPTPAEAAANGWIAPAPLYASLQLVGAPPFGRPLVAEGVFAGRHGTRLDVVTFEQDQLIRPAEGQALMRHLTGGEGGQSFIVVPGTFAVHDLYLSDPGAILQARVPTPAG